ncbi:MAG: cyclic nucleotide-binding domain-containing protein [Vicinamibacteria bacterium]|nr:cyclic nucleotide-binding domain-containing protein [Vicinamibacteria bacterium]
MAWFGAKETGLSELIARKKYSQAIDILRGQIHQGSRDPRLRMQIADVLILAGRQRDAVPFLIDLADEFALDGFAAKAVALLKKIQRIDPGRTDVEGRLARLIKQKRTVAAPAPAAASTTEMGVEEIGIEMAPIPDRPAVEPPAADREFTFDFGEGTVATADAFREQLLDVIEETLQAPPAPADGGATDAPRHVVESPLFDDFTNEELLAVMRGLDLLTFEAGDIIITEGEPGDSLFILTTGRVKAFVRNPSGHHVFVRAMDEGAFFGEISVLRGTPRTASVTAASRCELLALDRAALDAITASHPRVRVVLENFCRARAGSEAETAVRKTAADGGASSS